ncbi:MAG: hypothetical protein HC907_34185 [Richelia sp. SM1_7_0]|nr:hypothetical protein [Richelia sp. SM1_7_0]
MTNEEFKEFFWKKALEYYNSNLKETCPEESINTLSINMEKIRCKPSESKLSQKSA